MTLTELVIRQIGKFFLDDKPLWGKFRLLVWVLIPFLILIADIGWGIFGALSSLFQSVLILYFLSLISAFAASVAYIRDIYGMETDRIPFRHFITCLFGVFVPKIKVTNKIHDSDWKEMVEKIGGPAFLNIDTGYAVITETMTAPAHIYGQGGRQFVSWQERVQDVIDLHEQEGGPSNLQATSRDGIEVKAENLRFNFRIWDHQWDSQGNKASDSQNPFPLSKDAIHNFVYNRIVQIDKAGQQKPFSWREVVGGQVKGIVKGYINEHLLDDVIASREHAENKNPRKEIRDRAYGADFRQRMRLIGTILRWWDPGEFRSQDDIETQFLANWGVDLDGNIKLNQASGSAQIQAYEELGRAEAEAELLMSILRSLDGIKFSSDKTQSLQNLILMRTAQVIRALNTPKLDSDSDGKKQDADSGDEM
jgi:hypothetical protein